MSTGSAPLRKLRVAANGERFGGAAVAWERARLRLAANGWGFGSDVWGWNGP